MALTAPTPPEITQGVYNVLLVYRVMGQVYNQQWQYRRSTGPAIQADMNDLRVAWIAAKLATLATILPASTTAAAFVSVSCLSDRTISPSESDVTLAIATGRAGDLGYLGSCAVATKRTLFGGRSGRGRIFVGPVTETDAIDGGISTSFATALTATLNDMLGTVTGGSGTGYIPVVVSKKASTPLGTFKRASDWLGFTLRSLLRSQRRRNFGVGG